jgi:hypothetical protein
MRMRSLMGVIATLLATATSTISVLAADPDWPKSLTLGTASPGGVYYIYGEALAQILTEKLGIAVNPLPTQGPVHNVKLVDSGGAQLGLITMGVGLEGTAPTVGPTGSASGICVRCFQCTIRLFKPWSCGDPALRPSQSSTRSASLSDRARVPAAPIFQQY